MKRFSVFAAVFAVVWSLAVVAPLAASDLVSARQRVFGFENVDPVTGAVRADRVILSWLGTATFAASFAGEVVLLDAWVVRGGPAVARIFPDEVAAIAPKAIFIGHGHFDHALDAPRIVELSGAKLVGTDAHCTQVSSEAPETECMLAVDPGASFGARKELSGLLSGVDVTAVLHVHSAAEPPDAEEGSFLNPARRHPIDLAILQDLLIDPPPAEMLADIDPSGDEGGTVFYQFRVGDFALAWHDSAGPLKERAPNVFDVFHALPPTDVQLGAIQTFNEPTNNFRDPRMYVEALAPKIFVPNHHDAPVGEGTTTEPPLREEFAKIPPGARPEIRFLHPPFDYLRPGVLTFDPSDPAWR